MNKLLSVVGLLVFSMCVVKAREMYQCNERVFGPVRNALCQARFETKNFNTFADLVDPQFTAYLPGGKSVGINWIQQYWSQFSAGNWSTFQDNNLDCVDDRGTYAFDVHSYSIDQQTVNCMCEFHRMNGKWLLKYVMCL